MPQKYKKSKPYGSKKGRSERGVLSILAQDGFFQMQLTTFA